MNAIEAEYQMRKQRFLRKGVKYVLLSLLLTAVLIVSTGCAVLLIGENREAYDRLERAASKFKYPASVHIISGEMNGNTLYCMIEATNQKHLHFYGLYEITTYGDINDSTSSRCYSSSLNCAAINSALADHFGVSYSGSDSVRAINLNLIMGGLEKMWFVVVIAVAVVLGLNALLASYASDIAQDKGYEKRPWFYMCFLLGPIPYIIVAAMPDKELRDKMHKTNVLLEKLLAAQDTTSTATEKTPQA